MKDHLMICLVKLIVHSGLHAHELYLKDIRKLDSKIALLIALPNIRSVKHNSVCIT